MSGHARFAPSSAGRIVECPASLVLAEKEALPAPDGGGSIYAAQGTLAHWVLDSVLSGSGVSLSEFRSLAQNGDNAGVSGHMFPSAWTNKDFSDETIKKTILDREMVNSICVAVDFVLNEATRVFASANSGLRGWPFTLADPCRLAEQDKRSLNDPFLELGTKASRALRWLRHAGILKTEQKVILPGLPDIHGVVSHPSVFGFGDFTGTADIILDFSDIPASKALLYSFGCFDLKYGAGVDVSVKGNAQILYYLSAAVFDLLDKLPPSARVALGVIQPRTSPNFPVKTDSLTILDLLLWQAEKLHKTAVAAQKAAAAYQVFASDWERTKARSKLSTDVFRHTEYRTALLNERLQSYLRAGPHCRFCPVAANCPALAVLAVSTAQAQFGAAVDPTGVVPRGSGDPSPGYLPVPNSIADLLP